MEFREGAFDFQTLQQNHKFAYEPFPSLFICGIKGYFTTIFYYPSPLNCLLCANSNSSAICLNH
ncbi:hypothetical protein DXT35_12400 [Enterococcus faecalis]|nr:hypothetical protein [Enterococcus faecalis]EGO8410800.1 hypothetical protein [Enterococcus faecalis]EGO9144265.1 hypothetical protein [Enterococcus faecalis]EGO9282194.1 hypothetical protein [Enterococcus faecalis]EGO9282643.1 hypothetical protein [Enterococcus faecalis]